LPVFPFSVITPHLTTTGGMILPQIFRGFCLFVFVFCTVFSTHSAFHWEESYFLHPERGGKALQHIADCIAMFLFILGLDRERAIVALAL